MGLYNDKKDYEELVKENIMKAKLLYNLSEEDREKIIKLLDEKEKNRFFANLSLKKINKKIEKIKKQYK